MPANLYVVSKHLSFTFANTSPRATLVYIGTTYSVASMML